MLLILHSGVVTRLVIIKKDTYARGRALLFLGDSALRQRESVKELEDTWLKEEMYSFQCSKVNWLKYGDQNS